jgi:hypothetical protein
LFNEMFFVSFFLKFARAGLGSEPGILWFYSSSQSITLPLSHSGSPVV